MSAAGHLSTNIKRYPVVFARGEGVWLHDAEGNAYLDMLAGIATSSLGHGHPALTAAIEANAGMLHVSNLFFTDQAVRAAEALVERLGPGLVYFCNSGTEANEAAIKLARKHAWRAGERERTEVVSVDGSFHGRTMGALAATMQPGKWEGFEPLPKGFASVPLNDADALRGAISERSAAVMLEPIQGEAGVRPLTGAFANAAAELAREHGALLVTDEIQTGVGRTGRWWGYEHLGLAPDVVTLGKGLGGGFPVAAMWAREGVAESLQPSDHGTTIGGGPMACAVVSAVLETVASEGLVGRAQKLGERLMAATSDLGVEVRGRGLLVAVELGSPMAGAVVEAGLRHRVLVNAVTPSAVRLAPPLVITEAELEEGVSRLRSAIEEVAG